ncbi:hypothetical protein Bca4012_083769 [Brassica carinata]
MALYTEPGSWRGFLEQVSGPGTQFGNDETQPPSPQPPSPQIEIDDVPVPNAPTIPVELMTLDELLLALGRSDLPKIHPNRVNGAGWFEYTKGITKSIKKIMKNDFTVGAPNWTLLSSDTKHRWFKAFVQKYNWDYCHTTLVREHFDAKCAAGLLDRVYDWKVLWRQGVDNKPNWMKNSVWLGFIVYWTLDKVVKRSKKNSKNRNSDRGGYGISKHTCGSCPYTRMRENMRDKETSELPDMVAFMETTHKRKSDGLFVDRKAEHIVRRCRALEEEKLTQMTQGEETCGDLQFTQAEKIPFTIREVKVIKNGRRFGYGTMDIGDTSGPSYATQSPDYKALYLETQTKLIQVKSKCDELSSQVEDALYWSTFMRNMYPDHVPPSKAARQAATADNTFEA